MVAHQLSVRAIDHHSADTDLLRSSTPLSFCPSPSPSHFITTIQIYILCLLIKQEEILKILSLSLSIIFFGTPTYLGTYAVVTYTFVCSTHTHTIYPYIVYRLSHSISVASIDSLSLFLTHLVLSSYLVCCILDCIIYQLVKYIVRVVLVRQVCSH